MKRSYAKGRTLSTKERVERLKRLIQDAIDLNFDPKVLKKFQKELKEQEEILQKDIKKEKYVKEISKKKEISISVTGKQKEGVSIAAMNIDH